jgi:hypothetical protein
MIKSCPPEFHRSGRVIYRAPAELDPTMILEVLEDIEYHFQWSQWMLVDLSRVDALNSSWRAIIRWAEQRAVAHGGGLVLVGGCPEIHRAFTRSDRTDHPDHTVRVYPVMDDVPDAVADHSVAE